MLSPENSPSEPSSEELATLTFLGRHARLVNLGLAPKEALEQMLKPETAEEYLQRNEAAMEALCERITSAEYMAQYTDALREPDVTVRVKRLAQLKRENFSKIDMAAVHRTIQARNRQMKAEGVLPPDASI